MWNSVVNVCSYPPYLLVPHNSHHPEHYQARYQQLWGNVQLGGTTLTYDHSHGGHTKSLGMISQAMGRCASLIGDINISIWW
jgi:hypothetical protein